MRIFRYRLLVLDERVNTDKEETGGCLKCYLVTDDETIQSTLQLMPQGMVV
jgi:hypothetical protein